MEEEETLRKAKLANERLKLMKAHFPNDFRWWEEAIRESLNEKEREVLYLKRILGDHPPFVPNQGMMGDYFFVFS
ncbi:hypothetical protein [Bacillus sp. ISL-7]|uniref:hypothetical protein n=1 Tax=Bacillus sp. ISL-7 TaxID=2819136 RepID=UPI001BE869FC|nr:hypothetical protein [Bacillus sp. ISL-7]MBT2735681.1 hypothetical protein [Bacillus sp. ISL-7]